MFFYEPRRRNEVFLVLSSTSRELLERLDNEERRGEGMGITTSSCDMAKRLRPFTRDGFKDLGMRLDESMTSWVGARINNSCWVCIG